MLYHASEAGVFNLKDAVLESLQSMRRAGKVALMKNAMEYYLL